MTLKKNSSEETKGVYCIRSVSLPTDPASKKLLEDFENLCMREGWKFSEGVWEAISEYTKRHAPGNPQQLIIRFQAEDAEAYRAPQGRCGIKHCPNLAIGYATHEKTGKRLPMCQNHLKDAEEQGSWLLEK